MATTPDLAPNRTKPAARSRAARADSTPREEKLEDQVSQLQADLKAIAATLSKLSSEKVSDATDTARSELRHIQRQGQHVIEDVQDQASVMEKQLKDTIREKPLTAVATAIGIGYVLALLSRH
tara:strand:- start:9301 stop:9669 length:369 start_codon:yes stop_codon:yes gene_type:complete